MRRAALAPFLLIATCLHAEPLPAAVEADLALVGADRKLAAAEAEPDPVKQKALRQEALAALTALAADDVAKPDVLWLHLGRAQLRLDDAVGASASFTTFLARAGTGHEDYRAGLGLLVEARDRVEREASSRKRAGCEATCKVTANQAKGCTADQEADARLVRNLQDEVKGCEDKAQSTAGVTREGWLRSLQEARGNLAAMKTQQAKRLQQCKGGCVDRCIAAPEPAAAQAP